MVQSLENSWGNIRNSERFYFWGSKITADGDCSHKKGVKQFIQAQATQLNPGLLGGMFRL